MSAWVKSVDMGGFALLLTAAGALAQPPDFDAGKYEYLWHCAVCHGPSGKGNGPYSAFLTKVPSDLTTLAARNGGVFPDQRVYETIDGRRAVGAHGPRDMPVWGVDFSTGLAMQPNPASTPEALVRARILGLVDYLRRLQAR
ncbi:MAG TPA: hypothetical protein VMI15_02710 [Burkholderiales bacterium]|nr:hypothetical protein [Burkholderiales bacterium]